MAGKWNLAPTRWKIPLHRHILCSDVETQSCNLQHSKIARDNGGLLDKGLIVLLGDGWRCQCMRYSIVAMLMSFWRGLWPQVFFFPEHYLIETLIHPLLLQRHRTSLRQNSVLHREDVITQCCQTVRPYRHFFMALCSQQCEQIVSASRFWLAAHYASLKQLS